MQVKLIIIVLLFLSIIVFTACPGGYGYKYNQGKIPEEVTNFGEINSEYDDYNISSPVIRDEFPLIFSSNRNSKGGQFDYVYKLIAVNFNKETAEFSVYNDTNTNLDVVFRYSKINPLLREVNSAQNEYGPYLIPMESDTSGENVYILVYTYEENGNMDIKYYFDTDDYKTETPGNIDWINTAHNEGYPCFNSDYSKLVYCSDERGNFDIYEVSTGIDSNEYWQHKLDTLLYQSLSSKVHREKTLLSTISSPADDKCPFIDIYYDIDAQKSSEIMVFASNREGGFGGYDLYYSKYEDDKWSTPVNFGEGINTPYDEYRPVLRKNRGFDNDFLMFSSNRPGGKGGFDLYYVGVDIK